MPGQPAARLGDMHTCPMVDPGPKPHVGGPVLPACMATVLIGGMPAARVSDKLTCMGPPDTIVKGSANVLIGGKPAARMGDSTAHGGVIVAGCPTVLIGEDGGRGGGGGLVVAAIVPKPTDAERALAAQENAQPDDGKNAARLAAREKVAKDYYINRTSLGAKRFADEIKGIDLTQPVEIISFPPPPTVQQYARKGAKSPGNFFDPIGGQSADSLGLNGNPAIRETKTFKATRGQGLMSTAAPITDTWTDPTKPVCTGGGGKQLVVDNVVRDSFQLV